MANDIKQRIILEGEKEYSSALKQAQRNLKTLRTELKADTAELGNNATAQQKNQVRAKNLQKQIQEQEKAVKAHRDALEEVRKKYGDNEEAIAKYEQRLNSARAALADMKNQLDAVDASYDAVSDGAKKSVLENNALAESFKHIGEIANSVSAGIESVFNGIVSTVKSTVGAVWGELTTIAAKADNYMDLASYFGASATEVQKWDSAMKAANGDLSTVTSLITKLKYSGKDDKVAEYFGVSAENYENDLEYFQAVMQAMTDARKNMPKSSWNKAMADIFGNKKGFDVEGVLSDWDAIQDGLKRFNADEGGYGLNEQQIEDMDKLNTQVNTLRESWEKLKEMATVHLFGDLAIRITGNMQNIMDAFRDYINADDDYAKKAALESIKRNVREMFEAIRDAIKAGVEVLNELATEFKNDDDPTMRTIGNVLQWIADTIAWLADPENWEKIKAGIMIVLGAWLFIKLATVAGAIGTIAGSLKTIFGFKTAGTAASAASAASSAAGSGAAGSGAAAAGKGAAAANGAKAAKTAAEAGAAASGSGFFGGGASAGGVGTGIAGGGTLSAVGVLGGTAFIAASVYALSEYINAKNAEARKMREVQGDADRYTNYSDSEKHAIVSAVRQLEGMTAGSGTGKQLESLAAYMGGDLLKMFDYTNTSGEQRNKLMDMLDMDWQNAAVAAMMLHAAGIETDEYGKYLDMVQNGSMDYAWGLMTLQDFFSKSGYRDANGQWTIAGYNYNGGNTMYDGNGNPIANLSGYAMTPERSKPVWENGTLWWGRDDLQSTWGESGTWADWWQNPTGSGNRKVDVSDSSISGMKKAFVDGMSNVKVVMDRETVGRLVADIVSQQIAREAMMQ